MRYRFPMIAAALALLLCVTASFAQAPTAPPKPGPEVKKMGDMVGTWSTAVDMKPMPGMSPGGKATSTRSCVWTAGGFGISCKETMHSDTEGTVSSVGLMSYDSEAKNYIYTEVSTNGEAFAVRGTVNGDTWTFESDSTMQGKPMHARFTAKYTTKDTCEIKYEAGPDAKSMQVVMDGKETRVKSSAPAASKPSTK